MISRVSIFEFLSASLYHISIGVSSPVSTTVAPIDVSGMIPIVSVMSDHVDMVPERVSSAQNEVFVMVPVSVSTLPLLLSMIMTDHEAVSIDPLCVIPVFVSVSMILPVPIVDPVWMRVSPVAVSSAPLPEVDQEDVAPVSVSTVV
jgi:hypothetical protein